MNKWKSWLLLSVILLLVFAFVACESGTGTETTDSGTGESETTGFETTSSDTTGSSETTESTTTKPEKPEPEGNNVIDISYELGANNTVTLTYTMKGTVLFCGMEGYVEVPRGFTYSSMTQGNGATVNHKDGKVYFMFTSNSGQNVTSETVLFTVTFTYTDSVTSAKFVTTVSDIYDQNYASVAYSVNGERVTIKNGTDVPTPTGNNVIDISYELGANNTVTLTYTMKGTVLFCGMEGYVEVPRGFTYSSMTQGNGATVNHKDGKVYFMFTSNSGQNITSETVLFTVTFTYTDSVTSAKFATTVSDIYDQNYASVAYSVNGEQLT